MIPTRAVAADAKTHIIIGIDVIFHVLVVLCYVMFYSRLNFSAPAEHLRRGRQALERNIENLRARNK